MKNKKQSEQIQPISGGGIPNTRKQNKNISKNNKKFVKDIATGGFGILKRKLNCYFQLKSILILLLNKQKPSHKRLLNLK